MQRLARRFGQAVAVLGLVAGVAGQARAVIVVYLDRAEFLDALQPGSFIEDFQGLSPDELILSPRTFSGSGFSFTASAPSELWANEYSDNVVLAVNGDADTMTIASLSGPAPVTALGGYFFVDDGSLGPINPNGALAVSATDGSSTVTYFLSAPTSLTTFVGFISTGPALTSLSFFRTSGTGTGFIATNDFIVGTTAVAAVPEPSTLLSGVLAGLVGLGYSWRRRGLRTAA